MSRPAHGVYKTPVFADDLSACSRKTKQNYPLHISKRNYPLDEGKFGIDASGALMDDSNSQFQQVTLKVLRWEERDKRLVIKDAEVVA
jgi:hypothetical protein